MAEKGFGVKEVNLIGASGTPTITSPNNLNLNANNVAISTNVSIGGTLSVTGNVSVGGTLTYEDVTNIDSVGLITARSGLIISGVTTFNTGDVDFKGSGGSTKILFDASQDQLELADSTALTFGDHTGTGDYSISYVNGSDFTILGMNGGSGDLVLGTFASGTTTKTLLSKRSNNALELYFANNKKLETTNTGVNVTGAITVNGSALSIDPTNSDIQVAYNVTANGSSAYRFAGNGVVSSTDNPDLYLIRGQKYRFINNSGGSHPFQIREASGGTAYSTGVTNNGAASGNIDFAPTFNSPAQLVYQCTSHGGMVGNIYLKDGIGNETNVGVTTFSGLVHLNQLKKTSGTLDYLAGAHNFANAAGSTNYMTIASNGNFGLATTSPVAQTDSSGTALTPVLDLKGTGSIANESGVLQLTRKDNATQGSCIYNSGDDAGLTMRNTDGNGMGFYNGTILALRVDSNGRFTALGNKPSANAQMLQNTSSTNPEGLYIRFPNASPNTSARHALKFSDSVGDKAVIDSNGNSRNLNNSYGGFSDISLKENIVDAGSQWDDIKNIQVKVFNFKSESASDKRIGVIAQEIETVCPKLVSISYDKDVDGNLLETGVKSVKYSVLYMKAIKALQEAQARIENLETEVAALKAK